jgi:hypothetical protein
MQVGSEVEIMKRRDAHRGKLAPQRCQLLYVEDVIFPGNIRSTHNQETITFAFYSPFNPPDAVFTEISRERRILQTSPRKRRAYVECITQPSSLDMMDEQINYFTERSLGTFVLRVP